MDDNNEPEETVTVNPPEVVLVEKGWGNLRLNYARYNEETNVLYVCLAESVVNPELDLARFFQTIGVKKEFIISECFKFETDYSQVSSCKFYVPALINIEEGSKLQEDYPFNKPMNRVLCLNPERNPKGYKDPMAYCDHVQDCSSCSVYVGTSWEIVTTVLVDSQTSLEVERRYRHPRIPFYRISNNNDIELNETDMLTAVENHIAEQRSMGHDVDIVENDGSTTRGYFDTVLTAV